MGLDLRDLSSHARLVRTAEEELGGLDVMAHLAAVLQRRPSIAEVTEADWTCRAM
jgi:NAD(P)-dependent dehydrogenase (short-subunit alcohol dehydrogenase family)